MQIQSLNPILREDQIAKEFGYSSCTLQRYRNDIITLSPYRIPPYSHKRRQKISNTNLDDISNREQDLKYLK